MRPDGTHLTRLVADGQSPRVSADGRHVAYTTSNYAYTVLDVRTGARRRLTGGDVGFGWSYTFSPWSPDGGRLAVGAEDGVHIFKADGTPERVVRASAGAGEPTWSPDGALVAYSGDGGGIYVSRADGSGDPREVSPRGDVASWSPDGRDIAFFDFEDGATHIVPAAGGKARRLAKGWAAWSPDSSLLAVAGNQLALYTRDGALQRTLVTAKDIEDPAWSPDGEYVLAVVNGDLWLFARDGSSKKQLTQGQRNGYVNSDASWGAGGVSPAGAEVAAATRYRGPLVAVSRATGALVALFPKVTGRSPSDHSQGPTVYAVASDGKGGWYVGGDFGYVGGVACPNLAHIDARRDVDRGWCPRPDDVVRGLVRIGSTLYVGGDMAHVAGKPRGGLAAFSIPTGRLTSWGPRVGGLVHELFSLGADPAGTRIYVGGSFSLLGGKKRSNLGAVDARSGAVTSFAPNPDETFHGDGLTAFAVTATHVFASGFYEHIGGKPAGRGIAELDPVTGKVLAWKPACGGLCIAWSLAVAGDRVFAAGVGSSFGNERRDSLAAFSGSTATVDGWAPAAKPFFSNLVAPAGDIVVAALAMSVGNGHRLVAYSASSGRRVWLSPLRFDGAVNAIAADDRYVVAGGAFRNVR